jgi:spermidine synthase
MRAEWLFLAAYMCSGLASLIYELSWTRLLTLHLGHTTAAASTVVAAFMGGLAAGAAAAGRLARRLSPAQSLAAYILLESVVVLAAATLPSELAGMTPLLAWSYRNGAPGVLFPVIRLLSCLGALLIPATALGATFPIAVRWFVIDPLHIGRAGGMLYAINTAGALIGALAAGFLLIPVMGLSGTTFVGITVSGLAIACGFVLMRRPRGPVLLQASLRRPLVPSHDRHRRTKERHRRDRSEQEMADRPGTCWLVAVVLALSGFAALTYEIAWTRIFGMIIGPTTYALSATLTAVIGGTACGACIGSWAAGRTKTPALWLGLALSSAALAVSWASVLAGGFLPRLVVQQLASGPYGFDRLLLREVMLAIALVLPATLGLGAAFPLALELINSRAEALPLRLGVVYAVSTFGAMTGSLTAGFVSIPRYGLQWTLQMVSLLLVIDAMVVIARGHLSRGARAGAVLPVAAAIGSVILSPPWDRDLLASGTYRYERGVTNDLALDPVLKAGTLLYYRDGSASTISVKRMADILSLAIDGKVDASNSGDMLTQKTLAHLPLLLHRNPREICIIGLGSGVTLGSALLHPITRADVVEISPEVVEASGYFAADNRNALEDPRTHLILGDGRSHLLLSSRRYDVIISEPSNPWMAGVAPLFTREFFTAARGRLAPGGIICQWAHTYNISDGDLRSIVATFRSVFPDATMWLLGESDLLLVASTGSLDSRLGLLERGWQTPRIAADLNLVGAVEPFAFWSLFVGGPLESRRYAAGAAVQTDDRMALEFSAPRALANLSAGAQNASTLRRLLDAEAGPPAIRLARTTAGAAQWRNRGAMMGRADDYATAYANFVTALTLDPTDTGALNGIVQAAVATRQERQALDLLRSSTRTHPGTSEIWIAVSRLLAATGSLDEAIAAARTACEITPHPAGALEQLASLFADLEDVGQLDPVVEELFRLRPQPAASFYYAAGSRLLKSNYPEALSLARQAIASDPQYAAAYKLLGTVYTNLGQTEAGREAFQTALRFSPRDSTTYVNLGLLELLSANPPAAGRYFAVALTLDPASAGAQQGLLKVRQALSK